MTRKPGLHAPASLAILVALLAGCGLKGPLALPEKSERVIIRGPQEQTAPETSPPTTGGTATGSPMAPAPAEERPPPPPLPGGNPGTSRGG